MIDIPIPLAATRKVARTIVQVLAGLAAAVPLVAPVLGTGRTAAAYGVVVGVAAVITRVMHSPAAMPVLRLLGLADQPPTGE